MLGMWSWYIMYAVCYVHRIFSIGMLSYVGLFVWSVCCCMLGFPSVKHVVFVVCRVCTGYTYSFRPSLSVYAPSVPSASYSCTRLFVIVIPRGPLSSLLLFSVSLFFSFISLWILLITVASALVSSCSASFFTYTVTTTTTTTTTVCTTTKTAIPTFYYL